MDAFSHFSSGQPHTSLFAEDRNGQGGRDYDCPSLGDPTLVSKDDAPVGQHATIVTSNNRDTVSSQQAQSTTAIGEQTEMNCMQVIGESITKQRISGGKAQVNSINTTTKMA